MSTTVLGKKGVAAVVAADHGVGGPKRDRFVQRVWRGYYYYYSRGAKKRVHSTRREGEGRWNAPLDVVGGGVMVKRSCFWENRLSTTTYSLSLDSESQIIQSTLTCQNAVEAARKQQSVASSSSRPVHKAIMMN